MVKSVAPEAHVTQAGKNAKTPGSKGPASALLAVARKGVTRTADASGAATATKGGAVAAQVFSEILKKGLAVGAVVKDSLPLLAKPASPGGAHTAAVALSLMDADKEPVGRDQKTDQKKKAAPPLSVALAAVQSGAGAMRSLQESPSSEVKADLSQQLPGSSKAVAAQQTQPVLRVVDLRTKATRSGGAAASSAEESATAAKSAATATTDAKEQNASFMQRLSGARDSSVAVAEKPAPAASAQTQTPLERLRDMAGSELAQATNLILKDGGGEIRLLLKPESLGSVRIRMNVVDNRIEGTIVVDSAAVKHVFDGSVDALRRALTAEGFQTGSLSVSVGGQGADPGDHQQRQALAAVQRVAVQGFESTIPGIETMSLGDLFVNLFV